MRLAGHLYKPMRVRSLFPLAALALTRAAFAAEATPEQMQFFESKIRPILSEKCYKCHSVELNKSKGGLTLDTKAGLLKGGETGAGLKPGDPKGSLLIKAVLYTDPDLQMPPKGEKLSDAQIADLTSWIKMGAPDPREKAKGGKLSGMTDAARKHWAFVPVKKPEIPTVKNRAWCITPVDAFIMQKLEDKGMSPSPDLFSLSGFTGKDTMLRRATYDLTGLPPTPAEMDAFRADTTPYAFSNVVDRLLASPEYGERWGRYWLDSARYADTTGARGARGEDYRYAYAWTYRDWVIKAFNDDLPYDQFIMQQIAADKIPNNPPANLAALGFITVGARLGNANDVINDRIDVVTKGFVGLTVVCARCHDHMFDPIPTKDYYALHGVFASTIEPSELPVLSASLDPKKKAEYDKAVAGVEKKNRDEYYKLMGQYSGMVRAKAGDYLLASMTKRNADADALKAALKFQQDKGLDPQILNEVRRFVRPNHEIFGPFAEFASASGSLDKVTEMVAANAGAKFHPQVAAAFKAAKPKSLNEVADIYTKLLSNMDGPANAQLAAYADAMSNDDGKIDAKVASIALVPFKLVPARDLTTKALREEINKLPLQLQGRGKFDFAKVNELTLTSTGAAAKAMAVEDSPNPHDSYVFVRGQAEVHGDVVPRHFLEALSNGKPAPFKEGSGRYELAQAIATKSNPLTARVIVNRVWMHHFGQAFVRTPDDLGTRSETPSHQELLDYLSNYFMEQGWSMKKLHKLIMLSRVYSESSYTIKAQEDLDPDNRYLWRANVRRLDFEAFRDSLLVMSNRIDHTLGGQPVNLSDEPYSYRRSIYGYIDRGDLPELMQNFDFSNPDMPNSSRTSTIVPQQALFLMNSPMAVDVARRIIARPEVVQQPVGADFKKIMKIYEIIYGRLPRPDEISLGTKFISYEIRKQAETVAAVKDMTAKAEDLAVKRAATRANSSNATKAIQNTGEVVERKPLTPWETYAQTLLLSNEAAYVN